MGIKNDQLTKMDTKYVLTTQKYVMLNIGMRNVLIKLQKIHKGDLYKSIF